MSRANLIVALGLSIASQMLGQCLPPAWSAMNQLPGVDNSVLAATSWDPDGAGPAPPVLVVGGTFTFAGGTAANKVALRDGTSWQPLGTGLYGNDVRAFAVYNGELIAAGQFFSAGGVLTNNIARWNGTSWQPLGMGVGSFGQ